MEVNHINPSCPHCGHGDSKTKCVQRVPIFNHLDPSQMNAILSVVRSKIYRRGELIFRAGESSSALFIVNRGRIKIYRLSESGKEQIIRFLGPGEFTGEYALFSETIHESFAEAVEETMVCIIERDDLHSLLLQYPSIALRLLSEFSKRLESVERQTTWFGTETVERRIALYLLECAEQGLLFTLPMSKKDLASFLGTTPETISRKLREFEEAGWIKQRPHRQIEILDQSALANL